MSLSNILTVWRIQKELDNQAGIYAIINMVNGKRYIGSSINIARRLRQHMTGQQSNLALQYDISKYGLINFNIVVLELVSNDKLHTLIPLETKHLIIYEISELYNYKIYVNNILGFKHTTEARMKMSKPGDLNPIFGKTHTNETKAIISAKVGIPCILYTSDITYVLTFKSATQCAQYLGLNNSTICRHINSGKLLVGKWYIRKIRDLVLLIDIIIFLIWTKLESELVAGFFTEHSAIIFVIFFLAEYASIVLISTLTAILYFGGYHAPEIFANSTFFSIESLILAAKTCIFAFIFVWFRASLPRVRFSDLVEFCWLGLLPVIIALLILIPSILVAWDISPFSI